MSLSEFEPLDVLHVASFVGNIGDNANHNGTRRQLRNNLGIDIRFEESEMRKYYQNYTKEDSLAFDENFIKIANEKDLLLIGGGSFFDIWIDDSSTGTTIDLAPDQIDRITTPIVFHGLGCIPERDTSNELVDRFRRFLDHLFGSDHVLVSVRNDGSAKNIAATAGESYSERITIIPDGAFFVGVNSSEHPEIPSEGTVIGVNVASDMRERRFPSSDNELDYDEFVTEFSRFANRLLEKHPQSHLLFVPHIYSDFKAISDILSKMDLWYRRNRITTAPYLHGMGSERHIFDIYDSVDIAMGLRLHSNVCPIGLGTPSIGLANGHPKVNDLYHELGLPERAVSVHQGRFSDELLEAVEHTLSNHDQIRQQYEDTAQTLEKDINRFHQDIGKLIETTHQDRETES